MTERMGLFLTAMKVLLQIYTDTVLTQRMLVFHAHFATNWKETSPTVRHRWTQEVSVKSNEHELMGTILFCSAWPGSPAGLTQVLPGCQVEIRAGCLWGCYSLSDGTRMF